jgi:chromosome segregation ATPase
MAEDQQIKTEVELLKRDFEQLASITDKLDVAIDKLSSVANGLDRMIAVHENRLEYHDQIDKELFTLIEDRRKEAKEQYETLHKRMGSMRDEFDSELADAMKQIMAEIKDLKERDMKHHIEMSERLSRLEKWRWMIMGGAVVLGFIAARMNFIENLFN